MKRPARKAIPMRVKTLVLERQKGICVECGHPFRPDIDRVEFDHRPAIVMRQVNVEGTDYHPPQNDPAHIEALHSGCHLRRTVGRMPGAEKTATTLGSDSWLKAKFAKLEKRTKKSQRPKPKIPSRPFEKRDKRS